MFPIPDYISLTQRLMVSLSSMKNSKKEIIDSKKKKRKEK